LGLSEIAAGFIFQQVPAKW